MAKTFSIEDIRRLEKTISIREQLIDNLMSKGELPTKARDIDSFTNLLESVDRSIFSKAKINIEESAAKVDEETKEVLKDLLLNLHKTQGSFDTNTTAEPPSFSSQGIDINEGELIKKIDHQDISSYIDTPQ